MKICLNCGLKIEENCPDCPGCHSRDFFFPVDNTSTLDDWLSHTDTDVVTLTGD